MNRLSFEVLSIGKVVSPVKEPHLPDYFIDKVSLIEIDKEFEDALDGIENEEYVLVLFFFHKSTHGPLKVHPRGDVNRPIKGVFATCSPRRPNLIGVTKCKLNHRNGCILEVTGLDAIDGTPIIDIKPCRL
jgi:tRNA-Thr(GGU) m(6)t(6)A37 methyltransferase TsaA